MTSSKSARRRRRPARHRSWASRLLLWLATAPVVVPVRLAAAAVRSVSPQRIEEMTGTEFERHMAAVLRRRGYSVTITGASGDKGADLVVRRHKWSPLIVVQLKRYKGSVGVAAVQQAFGARTYYRADEAWVATTGDSQCGGSRAGPASCH
ncbi:MAG: restriction endonuclease [Chloroflexia bacterium]